MKKTLLILLSLILAVSCVFAWQKTYTVESEEYQLLSNLCNLSGISSPIMVSPISSVQMLNVLNSINVDKLDAVAKDLYLSLKDALEKPKAQLKYQNNLMINGFADLSFEFAKQSENESDFLVAKKDRKPIANLGAEIFFDDYIYAYFSYDLPNSGLGYDEETKTFKPFTTNIPTKYQELDSSSPHKAFVSLGGKHANLTVGRDKLNLGNGQTGNLALGNTLWYQDFIKASVLNGPISYDMTVISFQNSEGSTIQEHLNNPFDLSYNPLFLEKNQLVFLHNLSFKPVEQLAISLYEGALIYGNSIAADLRNINPMFVLHNTFEYMIGGTNGGTNAGNMNNFFGLEARYTFPKGWTVDAQAMFDQIQFSDEKSPEECQNAFGVLANVSKTMSLFDGLAKIYVEGAYTSPNLYLKEDQVACGEYWNLDFILGRMLVWTPSRHDFSYLGYKHGPDTVYVETGFDWSNYDNLEVSFSGAYKMHGTQGALFYEGQNDSAIAMGEDLKTDFITSPIESRLILNLSASYTLSKIVTFNGNFGFQKAWNYHNILKNNDYSDFQFAISATVHPMSLIKTK